MIQTLHFSSSRTGQHLCSVAINIIIIIIIIIRFCRWFLSLPTTLPQVSTTYFLILTLVLLCYSPPWVQTIYCLHESHSVDYCQSLCQDRHLLGIETPPISQDPPSRSFREVLHRLQGTFWCPLKESEFLSAIFCHRRV